ncbi:adenylyl-sulfate kinase [Arenibaculum pallidiluteum]|uniref:adenylyl-sulfate kinase n=1 Tax=Arenibaculum pallidiluteum TaxID=2812559 RepID=UPI001A958207|nr:adenylyl-sulfate kinase [Arenibaculum pallidiluteum]
MERNQLRIVVVGHVDHGKSTLIGRLLHDTGSLPDGKVEELRAVSERRGMPLEWSFVLDAFQAERDQAITIDTTQIWFKSALRDYVIIDAPGHREFLKNMVSGAAQADAAVLVVDAQEGVREQSRRHAYLLRLLGLRQVVVVVNKMDAVAHDAARFAAVRGEIEAYLAEIGVPASAIVPVSARHGENLAIRATSMDWYEGDTLLEVLDRFAPQTSPVDQPLRLPIQDVYKFDERRILVGRIETGRLGVGDTVLFSPTNRTARIRSIEHWGPGAAPVEARAGQCVGITLDEQIFAERGDVLSHAESAPMLSNVFRAHLFWLGREPLRAGKQLKLKLATAEASVRVEAIERVIDTQSLGSGQAEEVRTNEVAEVVLRSRETLALDEGSRTPATGRCVLVDVYDTVAGGVISMKGYPDQRQLTVRKATNIHEVDHLLTRDLRSARNGHKGAVVWLTGLSGAGKSTLAMRLEKRLFDRGVQTYVLDGDNVRAGLCADLGFSPQDRAENIRRVGEVAALFADAGLVVLTAFISPYRSDRDRARQAAGDAFHEIHVQADLATCEGRDPKGLYRKAREGKIPEFTGISAPYEEPEKPELVVDTAALGIEECVERVMAYLEERLRPGA